MGLREPSATDQRLARASQHVKTTSATTQPDEKVSAAAKQSEQKAIGVVVPSNQSSQASSSQTSQADKPTNLSHELPVQYSSERVDEGAPSETFKQPRKAPKDTMTLSDRKRCLIYTPDDSMKVNMKKHVYNLYRFFNNSPNDQDCWLHPAPPPARKNGCPVGTISCHIVWEDSSGKHKLCVNVGILALLIKHHLTKEQIDGYVNHSWHLSHLCGNWTCCNWRHLTVESGPINVSRNPCFSRATHCLHDPPCMRDRKRYLPITLAISSQIQRAVDFTRTDSNPATQSRTYTSADPGFGCGICGENTYCLGNSRICRSLESVTKCQKALDELESCLVPNVEVLGAISYLKQIIRDLYREKKASDSVL